MRASIGLARARSGAVDFDAVCTASIGWDPGVQFAPAERHFVWGPDRSGTSATCLESWKWPTVSPSPSRPTCGNTRTTVDWQEWTPEALAEAERRDLPILLSFGYGRLSLVPRKE